MVGVTLIGTRLARPGTEFVYGGEASGCADCPYRDQCLNLEPGRRYRVTEVRENAQTLECAVHADGVRAVEVEPVDIPANVPADGAYAGSRTALAGQCPYVDCPSHELCEPDGVTTGEDCRIRAIDGDPPHEVCHLDRALVRVRLEHPESGP